jgi:hypothetical protein
VPRRCLALSVEPVKAGSTASRVVRGGSWVGGRGGARYRFSVLDPDPDSDPDRQAWIMCLS